ncbi:MAG TPA: MauE/DoxX family redox-associated membrane protein [Candidatus Krumholzibacteria bacterium]|nr:MauE/DoxX family redox-associated membrane protein [Candidatus Krumholzibacteria bacterium]
MSFLRSRWLNLAARFIVGGLFFYAAFEKVLHPAAFAMAVRGYKLIPFSLSNLFAIAVSWSELVAATFLILGILTRKAAGAIFILLIVFIAAITTVMVRGMVIDCGCFGEGGAHTSWLLLVRNAALLFGTFLVIRYNDGWLSLGTRAKGARNSPTS